MAALDLGSNSFHLLIAEFKGDRLRVIDRLKDMVRLAEGLGDSGRLRDDVADRALKSLGRIGQRLRGLPRENVRIVGTNTLRRVRDGGAFLRAAEAALGFPVEVIAGREEARLIYLGVAHSAPSGGRRHLVVDIGGGSTELIIGTDHQPELLESLFMGCVSASQRFFPPGSPPTAQGMKKARLAARQEMESIEAAYRARGWDDALGASGTILAVQDAQAELLGAPGPITPEGLEALREAVLAGTLLTGVPKQRAAVFPGGLAILSGVFDALGLKRMDTSKSALREGLLWDLAGRKGNADARESTVANLRERFHIDQAQAQRVQRLSLRLLAATAEAWDLKGASAADLLRWAGALHELGMDVAHSQYHKHGAYLLTHMDLAGFSRTEQERLALLVRAHRRKFPGELFEPLRGATQALLLRLTLLLRCAVVLCRARSDMAVPAAFTAEAGDSQLTLSFPKRWLSTHPLTRLDLDDERRVWRSLGYTLALEERA